ncbi:MAG: hypothetical protein V3T83_11155 [Acidobacteriota bacterium]
MSLVGHSPRPPEMVREEIEDLRAYLAGLPAEWREVGSFLAYEEKLSALDQELALGRIAELASATVLGKSRSDLTLSGLADDQAQLVAILRDMEQLYARSAATHAKGSRWLSITTFVASSATVAFALASVSALVVPAAAATAAAAAAMALLRWSDRSRKEAKLADYFMAIRNEVMHFRQVSSLADLKLDASPTSARVEALIAEVRASQPH